MHLMLCNGLAFTLKSAPQVCVLFRLHAAEADAYLTQALFCFYADDVPLDVLTRTYQLKRNFHFKKSKALADLHSRVHQSISVQLQ